MNILMIIFYFPPISGGGAVVAADIANALARGHKVTVLAPNLAWDGPRYMPGIDPGIDQVRVDVPSGNIKIAARMCRAPLIKKGVGLGRERRFDFAFTIFHPFHMAPNAAVEIGRRLGIPVIIKIDDAVYARATSPLKKIQRRIERMLSTRTLGRASGILVANGRIKDLVGKFYNIPEERISIMPNGIDTGMFHTNAEKRPKTVVFSGGMYNHRGVDVLLNAAPAVIEKIPDARFVLLGEGPELAGLKKLAGDLGIGGSVEFAGWIPREAVAGRLADASVGIGPLRSTAVTRGALPIKALEYMAASLPVLGLKDTLPVDILEDGRNGYFVDGSEDLAARIILLLEDGKERDRMGKRSREISLKYDWSVVAKKIISEYECLGT